MKTKTALTAATTIGAAMIALAPGAAHAATPGLTAATNSNTIAVKLASRTITTADIGSMISMRITPAAGVTLDCSSMKMGFEKTPGTWTQAGPAWQLSGCWSGGANLVMMVTPALTGQNYIAKGNAVFKAGATEAKFIGKVTFSEPGDADHVINSSSYAAVAKKA